MENDHLVVWLFGPWANKGNDFLTQQVSVNHFSLVASYGCISYLFPSLVPHGSHFYQEPE